MPLISERFRGRSPPQQDYSFPNAGRTSKLSVRATLLKVRLDIWDARAARGGLDERGQEGGDEARQEPVAKPQQEGPVPQAIQKPRLTADGMNQATLGRGAPPAAPPGEPRGAQPTSPARGAMGAAGGSGRPRSMRFVGGAQQVRATPGYVLEGKERLST